MYPGSFDPLTTAHLAIAEAAVVACRLDRLDLVLSAAALAKPVGGHTPIDKRVQHIERATAGRPELSVRAAVEQLIADLAEGYDVVVLGADKWHQIHDPGFYDGSEAARDAAIGRLPLVAVAPRAGAPTPSPGPGLVVLDVHPRFHTVSSTAVRAGRDDWRA